MVASSRRQGSKQQLRAAKIAPALEPFVSESCAAMQTPPTGAPHKDRSTTIVPPSVHLVCARPVTGQSWSLQPGPPH